MNTRRDFLKIAGSTAVAAIASSSVAGSKNTKKSRKNLPVVISTWKHGIPANAVAWKILESGGTALDAVEQGVRVPEADPEVTSVGYGGFPDRDGNVTLDACIMDHDGNCGAVTFVQGIMHPISLARMVMERTPHIMLSGRGAEDFALANGFKKENLLTEDARLKWLEWLKSNKYNPIDRNNHDTIGMLAIDKSGNISGACTTSGLAWKLHGRVGDSPIIGAGLFVDNEIGGASATGKGESVIKIAGSHLIVELMRQGYSPKDACKEAVNRIVKKQKDYMDFQVGFIAINKNGETGHYAIHKEFDVAIYSNSKNNSTPENVLHKSEYHN
jgi:L-asparaginase/N4-(beta-N-acetylglucosaminyl)-L-asparaginase